MNTLSGKAAVVGVAESDQIGIVPDKPAIQLHAEAAHNALSETGLSVKDVDGICTAGVSPLETAEYMGIKANFVDGTAVGGASFVIHVGHAASALANGLCEVALITHGESGRSRIALCGVPCGTPRGETARHRVGAPARAHSPQSLSGQFEAPWGLTGMVGTYALACSRHMALYGTTKEQLAEIAVATRKWAAFNPQAMYRDPITIDDVLKGRWVAWPFNLLDCCLVTDAGGAVVLTRLEHARDLPMHPVVVLGCGEHADHALLSQTVRPA